MDQIHLSSARQGIENRLLKFCEDLFYNADILLLTQNTCSNCECFFVACCQHMDEQRSYYPCHHYKLIFTDGACLNNGRNEPRAGIAAVAGERSDLRRSRRVDNDVDPGMPRTSQRAELLGALEGLDLLRELWDDELIAAEKEKRPIHGKTRRHGQSEDLDSRQTCVIAMDSEYVVKGITDWYPSWKRRGWRTANGKIPANLDLFHRLNDKLTELEVTGVEIGFWRIPRKYNQLADQLAGQAAAS
ncbi:hypothetical protein D9758_009531 [Tetrapyrgos nigripes]|uniref:ribonuclease H n=1 Tax=Tetrapyrgos nigripes TaxID=182062 RepID=A0A8H5G194_9AGAR|nr:hypothetical protein D9758_009531 [Tetrapyrgos nigripes]